MIAERPRATAWALLAATCALAVAGFAALVVDNLDEGSPVVRGTASMVVYLGDGVDETHAAALATELRVLPGVEQVELVGAAESARRLERALGADSALLDGVDLASLPASVEVTLAPGMRDVVAMSSAVRALRGAPGVDDVVTEDGGSSQADLSRAAARAIAWTGALVMAALALVIVLAAIRVRCDDERGDYVVAHLLGASPAFTIVPTAIVGALHGLAAALLAALSLWIAALVYGDAAASVVHDGLGIALDSPSIVEVLLFAAVGTALGTLAGALAGVARALR